MSEFDTTTTDDPITERALLVYCRSWCPDCRRAIAWLKSNGIDFEELDVDRDPDARSRAESHNAGRLHTPTFEFGEDICVDFDMERLKQMLDMP